MKAKELRVAIAKVRRREVPKPTLEPIIEEFLYATKRDPVIVEILTQKSIPAGTFEIRKADSTERLLSVVSLFIDLFEGSYQSFCEGEIKRICSDQGSKERLIKITKLYISHLLNVGFSDEYIYHCVTGVFYNSNIGRCTIGLLDRFFKNFGVKKQGFEVVIAADKKFLSFLGALGLEVFDDAAQIPNAVRLGIPGSYGAGARKRVIRFSNIGARDPFSAMDSVELILSLSRSFLFIHTESVEPRLEKYAYVVDKKAKQIMRVRSGADFKPRRVSGGRQPAQDLARFVFSMFAEKFGEGTVIQRLISSLNSATLASKTADPESRLLSIWAAFEALLPEPSKDGEGGVRITHYSSCILPAIVFNYLQNTFVECYRNCVSQFGNAFTDCLEIYGIGDSEIEKFVSIFIGEQAGKAALCNVVSASPVMLMRFFRLEKLINSPKDCFNYLVDHEKRVEWQIHRIYRERNGIVHKASKSSFLDKLVENSYTYYRSVILALEAINREYGVYHPDQGLDLLKSLYFEYKASIEEISQDRKIGEKDAKEKLIKLVFSQKIAY
ncbi:hypothetical protein [Rhizobium sp. L1K21]|uniref:hypothetical protein n=1 Tax=Rhizobium sp. L1K21 TaxID=2954933 RepID=UPI002093E982|nr:hypothetical protein [Rhizobium sp. L1K21]MCO6185861.1 hypothetical protein [Rhizobium sp. L1K21]